MEAYYVVCATTRLDYSFWLVVVSKGGGIGRGRGRFFANARVSHLERRRGWYE